MKNAYNPGSGFKLRSPYGDRVDPLTGIPGKFHSGQDFAARAGTPIPAATSGKVVYSRFNEELGNVVIVKNDTSGYSLYGHMQDGTRSQPGQRIWQGDTVGLVGSTGSRTTGSHLHYSVINNRADPIFEDGGIPRNGGPIGLPLNRKNTVDPAEYDNYDPTPRYIDETRHVAQIMSGPNADTAFRAQPADQSNPIVDRFGKWGFVPADTPPLAPFDHPETFDNRFANWNSVPAGSFGNLDSLMLRAGEKYGSSQAADGLARMAATPSPASSIADNSPEYVFDPTKPPPPFSPSNYASALSSVDKWIASLAGVEPETPTEFQVPPIFSPFYRR